MHHDVSIMVQMGPLPPSWELPPKHQGLDSSSLGGANTQSFQTDYSNCQLPQL